MLRWRILGAVCILLPMLALMWADFAWNFGMPGVWLFPLAIAVIVLATSEVLDLLRGQPHQPLAWVVYAGVLMVVLASCSPLLWSVRGLPYPADCPLGKLGWTLGAFALAVPLAFVGEMRRYRQPGSAILQVALALFVIAYLAVPYSFLMWLRVLEPNGRGMAALLSVIVVAKCSDIGAYVFGRTLGRHKMTPVLSPGKTIEGAMGGLATGCIVSWAYFQYGVPWLIEGNQPPGTSLAWLVFGLLVTLAGMVGDLAESLLKRDMGSKDSSRWLRGLGGVMDILDSVLLAAPVAYLCWISGMLGR